MWPASYPDRLQQWNLLRDQSRSLPVDQALLAINDWWLQSPMIARTIIWEEYADWPDPWQLISDNRFCDLARALGMLYTVIMMEHSEIQEFCLAQTDHDNLVLVDEGKYILNWCPGQLLNITSQSITVRRTLPGSVFIHATR